ncbi:MAG TPA: AarF/UbiB family protein [Acidimicrobiia bacterium]|nr:AarF/UbiB family protein [Acidimicrobiia bacterium]
MEAGSPIISSDFRGPFAGGPPPGALAVDAPSLRLFGWAEVRRLLTINRVVTACLVAALARWATRPKRRPLSAAASEGVVDAFLRLGPMFIKLGQLLGSAPSVCPAPLSEAARRCIGDVDPLDAATVRAVIEADLGAPVAEVFASFDDRPLSAASVAQVHACVLPDGRSAVVKVQRPELRATVTADLRIQWRLMRLLQRASGFARDANVVGAIEDLHAVTFNELNFALEAHRQARFRAAIGAFGDNAAVTAPEVYWNWCGPRVICMERLFGVPIDDAAAVRARGVDGKLHVRRGVKVWIEACLVHGPFHGDVHAGNIWALDDGRLGFLDFGIVGELTEEWKELMRDFFFTSAVDGDFSRVARAYKRVGAFPADAGTDEEIGASMAAVFGPMFDAGLGEVPMAALLGEIIKTMGSYAGGAGTPKELQLIIKQLLYFERYSKEFAPDWPMFRDLYLVRNVFPEAVAERAAALGVVFPD